MCIRLNVFCIYYLKLIHSLAKICDDLACNLQCVPLTSFFRLLLFGTHIKQKASKTPYTLKEVSLYGSGGKPGWFLKMNPSGTVPVLATDDDKVYPDSELILDYIKDNTSLHAQGTNIDETKIQSWRDTITQQIIPVGKQAVLGGSQGDLFQLLKRIDDDVAGPYLCGDFITVADCAAFPFIWRIDNEFGLEGGSKLKQWLDLCSTTSCFKKTVQRTWWWWW